jgi:hypothetical protein
MDIFPTEDGTADDRKPLFWTLDRRIPLAVIVTTMVQFGAIIYWVASISTTVGLQGARISRLETDTRTNFELLNDAKVLLGRIDERTAMLADSSRHGALPK